ncbi:hypothetical protein ACFLTN_03245 [Chloroflexota bacterium]
MEKTWKPTVAGVLDIVAGALSFVGITFAFVGVGMLMLGAMGETELATGIPADLILGIVVMLAILAILVDILAIVGGIYALQRKKWGLALAGSIAAFFASWPLGVAAIVFTIISKKEFE